MDYYYFKSAEREKRNNTTLTPPSLFRGYHPLLFPRLNEFLIIQDDDYNGERRMCVINGASATLILFASIKHHCQTTNTSDALDIDSLKQCSIRFPRG